jgi:hypothetical protein
MLLGLSFHAFFMIFYGRKKFFCRLIPVLRIRIRDPGSGAFLTPGSGIGFFPDPGSRISDPGSRISDLGSRIPDPKTIFLGAF